MTIIYYVMWAILVIVLVGMLAGAAFYFFIYLVFKLMDLFNRTVFFRGYFRTFKTERDLTIYRAKHPDEKFLYHTRED